MAPPMPIPVVTSPPATAMIVISASPKPTTMMPTENERPRATLASRNPCDSARIGFSSGGMMPRSIIATRSRCTSSSILPRCRRPAMTTTTPVIITAIGNRKKSTSSPESIRGHSLLMEGLDLALR